jgi:hypothetical protein
MYWGDEVKRLTLEVKMGRYKLTIAVILGIMVYVTPSPAFSQEKTSSPVDRCSKAKSDHVATENEWSSLNSEVSFIREEIERSRNLRWDTKITLSVLDDALKITKEKGSLNDAQRLTLNSRIPNGRGTINPDGTFTISGLEGAPLKIDEAKSILIRLLGRSEQNIKKMETELMEKEKKSHLLSQKLASLEELVEKECKATGTPTPWEQGVPRTAGKDIYERYVEKEKMRQEEVESRRLADIERLWLKKYYPPYTYPSYPYGYSSRALLIELKNIDNTRTCLRCYPFSSSWEERQIFGNLDRSVSKHDSLPCVGPLGEYRVIQVYENIHDCYARMPH